MKVTEIEKPPSFVDDNPWYRLSIWGAAVGLGVYSLWPLLFPLDSQGIIDTDRFLAWQLAINDALIHGQLLHWMPYICGGVPALANPEYGALSPFNWIGLISDPVIQFKMEILIHLLIVPVGFMVIAKSLNLPLWTVIFGVAVWIGNGFLAFRLLHGQTTFLPLMLVPLLVGWMLQQIQWQSLSMKSGRWPMPGLTIAGIIVTSVIILEDGILVLFYTVIILGILASVHGIIRRDKRPIIMLFCWMFGALMLCAPRILPMIALFISNPRIVMDEDYLTLAMAFDSLFSSNQMGLYLGFPSASVHNIWAAYGAYCGIIPAVLSVYATIRRPRLVAEVFAPIFIIGVVVMFGSFASIAPWTILQRIPPFTMLHAAHRFVILVLLVLSVLSMVGLYVLHRDIGGRTRGRHVATVVVLVIAIGMVAQMSMAVHPVLEWGMRTFGSVPREIDHQARFTRGRFGHDQTMRQIAGNQAVEECNEPMPYVDHTVLSRPLSYTVEGDAQSSLSVKVNELRVAINADTPAVVVVNHNYHPDWMVVNSAAELGETDGGTMFLRVPKGRQVVVLRFEPRAYRFGIAVTSLFIAVLLCVFLVRIRGGRARIEDPTGDASDEALRGR